MSRVLDFHDGLRVRHWVDHNSVKVYNPHNVLRIETTINMPDMFRVYRRAQGQAPTAPKKLRDHGLIRKLPNRHRYNLTDKGRQLTTALNAMLSASTEQLLKIAA